MNTAEVLRAARAKIERPECWTKGAVARDASGEDVAEHADSAACWCALGAIWRVRPWGTSDAIAARGCFAAANSTNEIDDWNDKPTTTHADVLAAFDRAIALAEGK